jgi:putative FmdB family regulatory protein
MPIYIYQCDSCGASFEHLQRFSDEPLSECPECGGCVRRVIQPVGVIFRGSGFYVTDNRQVSSPTLKPPKDQDKAPEKDAGGSEEPKKEPAAQDKEPAKEPAKPDRDSRQVAAKTDQTS